MSQSLLIRSKILTSHIELPKIFELCNPKTRDGILVIIMYLTGGVKNIVSSMIPVYCRCEECFFVPQQFQHLRRKLKNVYIPRFFCPCPVL